MAPTRQPGERGPAVGPLRHRKLFGLSASDSTARPTLAALDEAVLAKFAKVRATVFTDAWGGKHPAIVRLWEIRKAVRAREQFPADRAAPTG